MAKINFDEVLTKSVTAMIVVIMIGAAGIVWQGATTVGDRINASAVTLQSQNAVIKELILSLEATDVATQERLDLLEIRIEEGFGVAIEEDMFIDEGPFDEESPVSPPLPLVPSIPAPSRPSIRERIPSYEKFEQSMKQQAL